MSEDISTQIQVAVTVVLASVVLASGVNVFSFMNIVLNNYIHSVESTFYSAQNAGFYQLSMKQTVSGAEIYKIN